MIASVTTVLADINVEYVTEDVIHSISNVTAHSPTTRFAYRTRAVSSRGHHHPPGQVSTTTELVRLFLCRMTFLTLFRLDTGIYIENNDFGERAYPGATFGGYTDQDGNGHGTAAASSAIGNNRGTATGSNGYAVKVFSDEYQANAGDIISGIQWVITAVSQSDRPSVMGLGFLWRQAKL